MKKLIVIFLLTSGICYSQSDKVNPCKDKLYLSLQKKDLDSLTAREYDYFVLKAKQCSEFVLDDGKTNSANTRLIFGVIFATIATIASYVLINNALKK